MEFLDEVEAISDHGNTVTLLFHGYSLFSITMKSKPQNCGSLLNSWGH